jgi:hypothetical protein
LERSADIESWPTKRELSRRRSGGIEVVLYWCDTTSAVTLFVLDERTGEAFEVEVDGAQALDAFNHPYAYCGAVRAA